MPKLNTYHILVSLKRRLPEWLRYRLDPYNSEADRFVARGAAELEPGARVLDAGAGECRHAAFFEHARYFATDNGLGDEVRWDYSHLNFVSDLEDLPVPDRSIDVVLNINVLEHLAEPRRALRECHRVLCPGGRLFLVAPQSWLMHQAPHDYFRYTCHGLRRLLTEAGLRVETIRPMGGFFTLLARRLLSSMIFFQRGLLWVLFPVVAAVAGAIALILPALDVLDRGKNFTLGYVCLAERPPSAPGGSSP